MIPAKLAEEHKVIPLRVEHDRHLTGLFPLDTWLELMEQGGFDSSRVVYPPYDEGYGGDLLVGVLRP